MDHLLNDSQIESLKELCREDEPSIFKELLELFVDQGAKTLVLLEQASANKDHVSVQAYAHKLKGSSANMGAAFMSYLCEKLEEAASEKADSEMRRLSMEIKKAFDLSVSCLKSHL